MKYQEEMKQTIEMLKAIKEQHDEDYEALEALSRAAILEYLLLTGARELAYTWAEVCGSPYQVRKIEEHLNALKTD